MDEKIKNKIKKNELNLGNAGELIIEYKCNLPERRICKKFLESFISDFARIATEFYQHNGRNHCFSKSETDCYLTIDQILSKESFKHEYEIKRLYRKSGRGRLDYLVRKGDYSFAIELKLSHKGYETTKINLNQKILKKHLKAVKQITEMKIDNYPEFCNGVKQKIRIALHLIVFYRSSKFKNKIDEYVEGITDERNLVKSQMNTIQFDDKTNLDTLPMNPTFKSSWLLDKEIVEAPYYKNVHRHTIYPGLGFIATCLKVEEVG